MCMWASGARGQGPSACQPAKPRHGSIPEGQPQDFLCRSHRWSSAAQRTTEHSVKQGQHEQWEQRSAEGTVLGMDWESAALPGATSPKGWTDFLGKPGRRSRQTVLGTVWLTKHISHATTWREGAQGRCFWNLL